MDNVFDVMRDFSHVRDLASFCAQLTLALSKRLELAVSNPERTLAHAIKFQYKEAGRIAVGDGYLDEKLFAYVSAGIVESQKHCDQHRDRQPPCAP